MESLKKECHSLLQQKENETTWTKINSLFISLQALMTTREIVGKHFSAFNELLTRSIQSDRSKLNGTCLTFLEHCIQIHNNYDFNSYIPILLKLSGRSNKIFVIRAQSTLLKLCQQNDPRKFVKYLTESLASNNKKIRETAFSVIAQRYCDNYEMFRKMIDKGRSDPSIEVRTICKHIKEPDYEVQNVNETPRKHVKTNPSLVREKINIQPTQLHKKEKMKKPVLDIEHQINSSPKGLKKQSLKIPNLNNYLLGEVKNEYFGDLELKQKIKEHKRSILRTSIVSLKSSASEDKASRPRFVVLDSSQKKNLVARSIINKSSGKLFREEQLLDAKPKESISKDQYGYCIESHNIVELEKNHTFQKDKDQPENGDVEGSNQISKALNDDNIPHEGSYEISEKDDLKEVVFNYSKSHPEEVNSVKKLTTSNTNVLHSQTVDLSEFFKPPNDPEKPTTQTPNIYCKNHVCMSDANVSCSVDDLNKINNFRECKLSYQDETFLFNSEMRSSKDYSLTHELIDESIVTREICKSDSIQAPNPIDENVTSQINASQIDILNRSFANISIGESHICNSPIKSVEKVIGSSIETHISTLDQFVEILYNSEGNQSYNADKFPAIQVDSLPNSSNHSLCEDIVNNIASDGAQTYLGIATENIVSAFKPDESHSTCASQYNSTTIIESQNLENVFVDNESKDILKHYSDSPDPQSVDKISFESKMHPAILLNVSDEVDRTIIISTPFKNKNSVNRTISAKATNFIEKIKHNSSPNATYNSLKNPTYDTITSAILPNPTYDDIISPTQPHWYSSENANSTLIGSGHTPQFTVFQNTQSGLDSLSSKPEHQFFNETNGYISEQKPQFISAEKTKDSNENKNLVNLTKFAEISSDYEIDGNETLNDLIN